MALSQATSDALKMIISIQRNAKDTGLLINLTKTEYMTVTGGKISTLHTKLIEFEGDTEDRFIKCTLDFLYLGSLIGNDISDIRARLKIGWLANRKAVKLWKGDLPISTKVYLFNTICQTIFLYCSESWVIDDIAGNMLRGCYTRMLRFAKGLDFRDHPDIPTIYGDMEDIRAIITRKRLRFIVKTLKNRYTTKQVVCHIWESLINRYRRPTAVNKIRSSGFAYIDQLFDNLDRCEITANLPRNQFDKLTELIDRYSEAEWNGFIDAIVATLPKPAPIHSTSRHRDFNITPQKKSRKHQLRNLHRTPNRSAKKRKTFQSIARLLGSTNSTNNRVSASFPRAPHLDINSSPVASLVAEMDAAATSHISDAINI
jgi:hypothetical protein